MVGVEAHLVQGDLHCFDLPLAYQWGKGLLVMSVGAWLDVNSDVGRRPIAGT